MTSLSQGARSKAGEHLHGTAKDTRDLACKISKQMEQGEWTKCSDSNETMCPDQRVGTNGLHQLEETQGEGPRGRDMTLSHGG